MPFEGSIGETMRKALLGVFIVLGVFLIALSFKTFSELRYVGAGMMASNTISVSGQGEALGVPDIATFSFSVVSQKATVAEAQTEATEKINLITDDLVAGGIDKKDIQTSDYSVYPRYEYQQSACANGICPTGKQVLLGYEVRQTTGVKVRDTAKAGELLTMVGTKGATEVSGLSFTFDKPTAIEEEARAKAIADAKAKAEELADELGVDLVRVVSFNESGGYPSPMYSKASYDARGGAEMAVAPVSPEISVGQNKVTSNVTITYEIR